MPKRRANGEGNIRKRKDGRWEGRYTVGHDPETGKAIIKNVLGKTQAEVKEKLKKAIEENVGIDYGRAKTYTVGTWLEVWMENYAKIKLRPSTYKTSQGFLKNHIKPQIGSIPLAELTSLDLQRFYKHLLDGGRVDRVEAKKKPKGLAPKTVRNIHQVIGSAYNLAMEQKLVTRNPTQGCALPKVEHKEMKTLTADQLSAFFQEARDSGVYELYYLDLATGLRRGELLGLKWTDVDFQHGVLKIQRAISRQSGKVVEAPLKTKNAYRTLPLSADAIDVLMQQRRKTGNSEWVFPSPAGGPMSPDSVLHMLQRVLKRAGLPRIRFHDLRHTFATMALQNGVDVKTVSSMLGHYSAGFTLDTYAHVTTDAQLKAAQTMGSILSRGYVKKCAVGKYPKSEKPVRQSGCLLRLHPLPVPHGRQPKRVARVDPDAVVVDKNIAENDRFDLFSRQLVRRNLIDLLFLERGEKALHPCVVEAMSGSAEALYHAVARQLRAKSRAGVLTPAV